MTKTPRPTLLSARAHLLCVGEHIPARAYDEQTSPCAERTDAWGTWEIHSEALGALERAIKLAHERGSRRIMLDMGDCFCLDAQDWRGGPIDRLARYSIQQPASSIVMTGAFQDAIRPHIEDPNDLTPLLSPVSSEEGVGLSIFQAPSQAPTYARSNIVLEQREWMGDEAKLEDLARDLDKHPGVILVGAVGTGKSVMARAYAAHLAARDARREIWWLSLEDCARIEDLARKFARTFQLRLGAREEHWGTRITAMLSHRPLPPTLILDGVDALEEKAHPWLGRLIQTVPKAQWLITSRQGVHIPELLERRPPTLSEVDALTLLMRGGSSWAPVDDLISARKIWRACAGHPAALVHARRHIHTLGSIDTLEDAVSEPLRLERDWRMFGEDEKTLLLVLGRMASSTSLDLLERIIGGEVDGTIAKLERVGWLQRDPSSSKKRWTVPGLFKTYTEDMLGQARVEEATEMRTDALLAHLSEALEDLRTRKQPEALRTLFHHEVDMLDMLDWGLEHRTDQTMLLVAKMRMFYSIAHSSFLYLPLLERAMHMARELEKPALLRELTLSQAIFADYNPASSKSAGDIYNALLEVVDEFEPRSQAELYYFYAAYLEDMVQAPEDLDRCVELFKKSIDVLLSGDDDLCRRAGCHCALARVELQRNNIDRAFEHSLRGRELAIATGSSMFLGMTSFSLHRVHLLKGEREQARRHGQAALNEMEKAGAAAGAIMVLASIGYMYTFEAQPEKSRVYFHRALRAARANSYAFGEMNCHYLLGLANLLDLRWEHAREHLLLSERFQIEFDLHWNLNQNKLSLAIALSGLGETDQARNLLGDAEAFFAEYPDPEINDFLAMARFAPEVYEAGWTNRDLARLDGIENALHSYVFENEMASGPGRTILLAFIEAARRELGEAAKREMPPIRMANDGSSFCLPGGVEEVDLSRRRTVKRVLAILVEARQEAPGEALDAHTLVERGWPGEVFEVRAGLMRLYVTINTLRKLGLEDVLQTHGEGYRLDPNVPVEVYEHPTEE